MKLKAVTLLIILLAFIVVPTVMQHSLENRVIRTTALSSQTEEEVHKHFSLDIPDFLFQDYKKNLSIFHVKKEKLIPSYSFTCCISCLEYQSPPPEFSQYII